MPTFELSTKFPRAPQESARIFRLAPPRVSQKTVLALARCFGLKGNMKSGSLWQDARQTSYTEGSRVLVILHASGGLRFHDKARWQVDDGASHVEFDDATAIHMAERFVEAHSVVLLEECKVLRVTRLNVAVAEKRTGLSEHRVIDVGVAFGRIVDGIPVEGPGGKVVVYMDSEGALTGVDRLWRDVQKVHAEDVPLRSADAVQQEAVREWGGQGSGVVSIDDIRYGYFEHGWHVSQRYLQPAYLLSMTITATEGHFAGRAVMRSEFWGAAGVKSPERLVPRRPALPPQAPRRSYRDDDPAVDLQ
jgi:hypothetical protein